MSPDLWALVPQVDPLLDESHPTVAPQHFVFSRPSVPHFYLVADPRFAQCANYPTDQPTFSGPECAKCGTDRPTSPAGQGRSWVACTTLGRAQTKSVQF